MNKSTIRSWKSSISKPAPDEPTPPPLPAPAAASDGEGYEEQTKHYIQLLMTQTGTKASELEGVDEKSKILVLKNKLKELQLHPTSRAPNSSILPNPNPIGQNTAKFGIDEYINFNAEANEITMEIPMSKLMDPEENKKIRDRIS